jgi:hypothetical protein
MEPARRRPAAVVLSKARLLHSDVSSSLVPLGEDVLSHARGSRLVAESDDLLLRWIQPAGAARIRRVERAIHRVLVSPSGEGRVVTPDELKACSSLAALMYLGLFRVVRQVLRPFFASNPTWIRLRVAEADRVTLEFSDVARAFRATMAEIASQVAGSRYASEKSECRIELASSTAIPLEDGSVDSIVTSPPYCTRIDYAVATLPELAVLGMSQLEVDDLRHALIGSPKIGAAVHEEPSTPLLTQLLATIASHESYAATNYYLPFYRQYFRKMVASIRELDRVTKSERPVAMVVQDSYFKDIHVDTPALLGEIAEAQGWELLRRHDFVVKSRAAMHPHRRAHRTGHQATEAVTLFSTS